MNEILKTMNRSISNQDYADLFNDGLPWRENHYKIDFSQFLSIMERLVFFIKVGPDSMLQALYGYELY